MVAHALPRQHVDRAQEQFPVTVQVFHWGGRPPLDTLGPSLAPPSHGEFSAVPSTPLERVSQQAKVDGFSGWVNALNSANIVFNTTIFPNILGRRHGAICDIRTGKRYLSQLVANFYSGSRIRTCFHCRVGDGRKGAAVFL